MGEIRKRKGNGIGGKRIENTRRSSDSGSDPENGTIKRPNGESNTGTMVQQADSTLQFSSLVISRQDTEEKCQMNSAFKNYLNDKSTHNGQYGQRMQTNPDSITSQFRDVLNGNSLSQYSTTDLRQFLDMLD